MPIIADDHLINLSEDLDCNEEASINKNMLKYVHEAVKDIKARYPQLSFVEIEVKESNGKHISFFSGVR